MTATRDQGMIFAGNNKQLARCQAIFVGSIACLAVSLALAVEAKPKAPIDGITDNSFPVLESEDLCAH